MNLGEKNLIPTEEEKMWYEEYLKKRQEMDGYQEYEPIKPASAADMRSGVIVSHLLDKDEEYKRGLIREKLGERVTDRFMEWLEYRQYYECPAAKSHHGNYKGGLFKHSVKVAEELEILTDQLGLHWQRPESPWVVGLLHDVCKTDDYDWEFWDDHVCGENRIWVNKNKEYSGHGSKSVIMLASYFPLTEEEKMCIVYHMGAFTDKEEWEFYSRAVKMYPNVLYTHTADMIVSNIKGV